MRVRELLEGRARSSIVVDVQPAYLKAGNGDTNYSVFRNIARFLKNQHGPILMFVNADGTGMTDDDINEIIFFWNEELGVDDDFDFWDRVSLVDKGYGYLRSWMDMGIDDRIIIKTIRLMYQEGVTDSRDLFGGEGSEEYEAGFYSLGAPDHYVDNMMSDGISVEWTSVAQLKKFSGSYIMGGACNECLKEVQLLMNAFNIKYKTVENLVY